MRRAIDYLVAHLDEPITLLDLAHAARVSPSYLSRQFPLYVGEPPHQALLTLRLARARGLLVRGTSIASAASQTGFADQAHLCRTFKRRFGMTPGEFVRLTGR